MKYFYTIFWSMLIVASVLFIINANALDNRLNQIESTIDEINVMLKDMNDG